jgi:putative dehydrogenase
MSRPARGTEEIRMNLGVIGLGIMGSAIAWNCGKAGFPVVGFDLDLTRCQAWREAGGTPLGSAAEVAATANVVLASLPNPATLDDTAAARAAVARPRQMNASAQPAGFVEPYPRSRL